MPRRSNRLSRKPRLDYKKYNATGMIVAKGATPAKRVKSARATGALAQAIRKVVRGSSETKMVSWYNGPVPSNGTYAQANYVLQNPTITSNATDIQRLIPYVVQGISDNQRIGETISPVSLNLQGTVMVNIANLPPTAGNVGVTTDIYVVIYILQHVTYKSYTALAPATGGNDFTQLLRTGENTTVGFQGHVWDSQMPVEDAYYRLLKKKKYRLRYAGKGTTSGGDPPGPAWLSVPNTVSYRAEYNMNLSKYLPKKLKYPENTTVPGANDPTNSSLFMCMGCYQGNGLVDNSWTFSQQYVTHLKYKDL